MLLHPRLIEPVSEATARVARQAFPKSNRYILQQDVAIALPQPHQLLCNYRL
jgi:hypothetical protein